MISNPAAKMCLRRLPYAFTEQGVAMLSSVMRSERAVQVKVLALNAAIAHRLRELENRVSNHDEQIVAIICENPEDDDGAAGTEAKARGYQTETGMEIIEMSR